MYREQVQIVISAVILIEGVLLIFCGYLASYLRWVVSGYLWRADPYALIGIILFMMFVNALVMGRLGLYSEQRTDSRWVMTVKLALAVAVDFSILFIALFSIKYDAIGRLFLLIYAGCLFGFLVVERWLLELYLARRMRLGYHSRQILMVGADGRADHVLQALNKQLSWGHVVVGYLRPDGETNVAIRDVPELGLLSEFERVLTEHSVDEVIFALPRQGDISSYMELCKKLGLSFRVVPALYQPDEGVSLTVERIQDIPTLSWYTVKIDATGLLLKSILDLVAGAVGCFLFVLSYPVIGLAIKLDSPGPILFKQKRVGQNRRAFYIYKFRTMYMDAEKRKEELLKKNIMSVQMFKMENDPRVTRMGRFLRKTSLDEIPQFMNVLKGEISLVGTRPPTPDEVEHYEDWHIRRISMKPGITGLWQISGRNKIQDFNEVVKLDLEYIDNWRFIDDLKIIWKTVFVVLKRKGAL